MAVLKPRADVVILEELCKACELCVVTCPQGNLKLSARLNHAGFHPTEFSYRGTKGECTGCGICYWVCPDFAISEIRVRA
jgi:2-oxoglutarate ferredoxin oxidoreductase subunit delta